MLRGKGKGKQQLKSSASNPNSNSNSKPSDPGPALSADSDSDEPSHSNSKHTSTASSRKTKTIATGNVVDTQDSASFNRYLNTAAAHCNWLHRLNTASADANSNLQKHLAAAAVLPRQLLHHVFPIATADATDEPSTPYQPLASSPSPTSSPTSLQAVDTLRAAPVLPPLDLPPPLPDRPPAGSPPPPPLPPRDRCTSPLSIASSTGSSSTGNSTMYRPSSATSSSPSTAAPAGSGFGHPHQPNVAFMPAMGHASGSMPMPQPTPMPMPGSAGVGVGVGVGGIYPPPSPSPSTVSSSQYPLQHPHAHAHAQQQQPSAPHSVTSSLGSLNNQSSPTSSSASFNAPPRYFATNASTYSTASTASSHAPAAPHAPPMAGNYQGRNTHFFHDPTVPIPAIPDTLKKQPKLTSSASSIHSGVSSAHTLATDPSNLPRQILDIDRRVMLFVSASGTNPMSLGAFPHDIEDVMFASSPTPYDMEILPEYDTTSLDAAAKRLLLYIKLMSFDTKRTMRVMLVGVDVGGIVALEAVRMFLGAVAAQTPQFGARGAVDPRDREANWLLRVVFDGILCVNAPVFLLHPQVFGNVDRTAFGKHVGLFAFPPEPVQAHGTGSSSEGGSGRKKDRGGVFGFGKLAKVVGGMAGNPSSSTSAGASPVAPMQIPFDASWATRLDLMAPLLRSQDDRINRITQLLHAKVPLAFLVTQTSNPQAVTSPTFVHIPDNLPEYISRLVVRFTAPPTSPVSSYQLIAEALDKGRQPAMYAQMIQYITRVAGHWASVAR
ncbi:hypothetical protein BCR44DRAFT_1440949 [Catenaria anguillulae PL171]|uniref:Uncharacterized protein n=1 Tax=Catenaria anguillulae PL171 TaxID=765915 RepID=A0A1Y2HBS3_9FUNG|nr:hypothetical protein BCR44DRAFT_1440949 [Catenaria anguillulae PL171]